MEKIIKSAPATKRSIFSRVSEITISYQPKIKPSDMVMVKDSREAYDLFMETWDMGTIYLREEFKVMILNSNCRVKGIYSLSIGGLTGTVADPRIIVALATGCLASGVILAHNHPSGCTEASEPDLDFTRKLKTVLELVSIKLTDHLIITPGKFSSMADEEML